MTGTARAALRLALGVLRQSLVLRPRNQHAARRALTIAWHAEYAMTSLPGGYGQDDDTRPAPCWDAEEAAGASADAARLIRARLALYLRAVLRAEAGDIGHADRGEPWEAWTHGAEHWFGYVCRARSGTEFASYAWPTSDCYERVRLAVPLWSQAPGRKT